MDQSNLRDFLSKPRLEAILEASFSIEAFSSSISDLKKNKITNFNDKHFFNTTTNIKELNAIVS